MFDIGFISLVNFTILYVMLRKRRYFTLHKTDFMRFTVAEDDKKYMSLIMLQTDRDQKSKVAVPDSDIRLKSNEVRTELSSSIIIVLKFAKNL
jgi:hypothetical protein